MQGEDVHQAAANLMSTGTSSTLAKVDSMAAFSSPYFANILMIQFAHQSESANSLVHGGLVAAVLQPHELLHALLNRLLQLLEVHLEKNSIKTAFL